MTVKIGDTVIVTQPRPCGCLQGLGEVFRVKELYVYAPSAVQWCRTCRRELPPTVFLMALGGRAARMAYRLTILPPYAKLQYLTNEITSQE